MYYNHPPQQNMTYGRPNYAQVQSWEAQRWREEAMERAGRYFQGQGWETINAQQTGDNLKVHLCDRNGDYHTVTMDRDGNVLQNQAGYQ
jgi:hypothetical protein